MKLLTGNIEELMLTTLLKEGSLKASELVELAFRKNQYTKQGVYRVLRKLRSEEKIVIYKSVVSINNFWREQLQTLLASSDPNTSIIGDVRGLTRGDRVSLRLRGLSGADQVWSHLFVPVEKALSNKYPLYLYNPHNWSGLLRSDTDRVHSKRLEGSGRPAYLLLGSTTELDKTVTRALESKYVEYSFSRRALTPSYIAVIGDYIFQMKLAGEGNRQVDSIFASEQEVSAAKSRLEKLDKQVTCRMIIEKSPPKAMLWKKRIGKDFFIPKKHRDF